MLARGVALGCGTVAPEPELPKKRRRVSPGYGKPGVTASRNRMTGSGEE